MTDPPIGPRRFQLERLPPGEFEELVFLLAQAVEPGVLPVKAKDFGLDARRPGPRGRETIRGWQAKRYTGKINWAACEYSLRRAHAFWRPPWVTFCFPRDLSAGEQRTFEQRLVGQFPFLRLDYWVGTELERLLRDTEGGRRATRHLFVDPGMAKKEAMGTLAVGGELTSTAQAIERLSDINEFLQSDPHVRYAVGIREPGAPGPPLGRDVVMGVELVGPAAVVRIEAAERYPGAIADDDPIGALVFEEGEAGNTARNAVKRLLTEGGRATISSGMGLRLDRVPQRLAELVGDDVQFGSFELLSDPQEPVLVTPPLQPVLVAVGEAEAAVELVKLEPPERWDAALGGGFGGLEIFYLVRRVGGSALESQLEWRWTAGVGTTLEQLVACDMLIAALSGDSVELRHPANGDVLLGGTFEKVEESDELDGLSARRELLGLLGELEAWNGERLDPPAQWSENDVAALSESVARIRRASRVEDISWERQIVRVRPGAMSADPSTPQQFAFLVPLYVPLFERVLPLRVEFVHLPEGRIQTPPEAQPGEAEIVPVSKPGRGTLRLYPPDEVPLEVATPRT